MAIINENFLKLSDNYLFSEIAKRVKAFKESYPDRSVISLGIGDVTQPLPKASLDAMSRAVEEMGDITTFRGYGPEHGYDFLIDSIISNDYLPRGVELSPSEVFISDGAKSDCGNIGDILSVNNSVAVTDPVYPVYVDSNVMSGRAGSNMNGVWSNLVYMTCNIENHFKPTLPKRHVDIIYLCYPNNPMGVVLNKEELKEWVDYALENDSVILYDAAYEAYIQDEGIPHSIYEIEGAKRCAIEFRSFSKTAGFTGVRCGYTVVPEELTASTSDARRVSLNKLWNRRQCTKFNGTSYITQRGAEAIYTEQGKEQVRNIINYYMSNAMLMRNVFEELGANVYGGENAPYLWLKTPDGISSWDFFDRMLYEANVVVTPGIGFGPSGEGFVRLTAFGRKENCSEAMNRIKKWFR